MIATEAKTADFVITRVFDAPRELVWQAFADPERMQQWFGPKGSTILSSKMDLRVGGTYHGAMRNPDGQVMWASSFIAKSTRLSACRGCIRSPTRTAA